uniref:F5/8 type C domain-containing protein n=1 Tax=Astatotilapia calliptera TaxID=8154 RepID=A0AAX7UX45_ASTCA
MEPTSAHAAMRATLALLLPLLCSSIEQAQQPGATVREYYIAAVEIGWDYEPHPTTEQRRRLSFRKICVQSVRTSKDIPQKYIKAIYREYTDSTYTVPKPRPAWTGIQGPVIVTQAGETVVVHFKNLASQPYSISPVGITYWKQSEGAGYDDSTAGQEKEDDAVSPGGYYEYVWDISPKDGPTTSDPDCLTYSYTSRVDTVRDLNSGLIGALLICKASKNERRYPAFVLFFAVFDETKSWYGEVGERVSREKFKRSNGKKEYHTINGFVNSTLPGLTMCQGRNPVFWHLIGMSTAPEIHSIQFQDHSLTILNHRKVTVEVTPMSFITAEMRPHTIGSFLISCKIHAHRHDGMNALFTVEKKCPEVVTPPAPNRRQVKHEEDYSDENFDDGDLFNVINVKPKNTQLQVRSLRGQESKTWVHYIAAEEVTWNYAPHLKPSDSEFQSRYLPSASHHLSYQYKKVVYVEYTDGSFTQRKDPESPLLGPILKGKVNDQFHITFKNLASRPFNIYPNGLTKIFPLQRSTNGKLKRQNDCLSVLSGFTFGYIWRLTTDDGPLEGDPTCLTQLYQSTVSPERDLASGLVGTLLICKYDAIDFRGRLVRRILIFAIFDENRSWYFDENMRKSTQKSFNTTEPDFYNSNVIYSVNGIMFSRRQFVMCQTDVTFWHVASVGTQSDFLSVYFTGNMFQYQGLYQSVLTLFPMTAITLPMETELIGKVIGQHLQRESAVVIAGTNSFVKYCLPTQCLCNQLPPLKCEILMSPENQKKYIFNIICVNSSFDSIPPFSEIRRGIRKFLPDYKKVVFRAYKDKDFLLPEDRGELQEHLGIMGPVITTEINDLLTVTFKNSASRPFSFHLHGVYDRSQGASTAQTSSPSAPPGVPGEPVPPGEARTYNWRVTKKQGPTDSEFDCKTGAYYSTVDKEKDLHSGLIGPLVICKPGTLRPNENTQPGIQAFSLLFHTFDETKSWYLEENLKRHCAPPCQVNAEDPWYHTSNKFAAINGYVAETLPGLLLAQYQRVRWHLLNVGSDTEIHAVHFHGLPFTIHAKQEHRMGVYNLFPGVFGTVEMRPPTVGTWLVECTIGDYQLAGMRAKLLVYDPSTYYWEPALARLDQSGYINAWMGKNKQSWIQVDLQRPTLMHGVQTQGVRSRLREHYITYFTVSYSLDQETWTNYRGNETSNINIFHGNLDSSKVKENLFSPPFVARYIRIHPYRVVQRPALRLELLGCDLNSCSLPLGLQRKSIPDGSFSASSSHSSFLRTWKPSLARLHQEGGANAWRPMNNNPHEWLQVDLEKVRRITGVITQGARSLMTQMMVTEFSVTSSLDGHSWSYQNIFKGNDDPDEEAINVFEPPLFARYIRIHPRGWIKDIALRLEVLGCDTQQGV